MQSMQRQDNEQQVSDVLPKFTVCIPVFNGESFLVSAVQSVLDQDAVDVQLYVVDDCSSDHGILLVEALQDERILIARNTHRLGLAGNWNRCLALATDNPVLLFHQDDRMRPGYLARASNLLNQYPDAGFVFSNIVCIDEQGRELGGHWSPHALPHSDAFIPGAELVRGLLSHGNFIPCQTVVVRASAYAAVGGFNAGLGFALDLEMWLRLASKWGAAYLADPYVEVRRHGEQESNRFLGSAREIDEVRLAFLSFLAIDTASGPSGTTTNKALARRFLRCWSQMNLRQAIRSGQWSQALGLLDCIVRMHTATLLGSRC